ncbi:MAG: hypothetical protein ACE5KM_06245 [Planctomycetaceae bacterium]
MKSPITLSVVVLAACALGVGIAETTTSSPQIEPSETAAKGGRTQVRRFMRVKLKASESVLEGLVTEDFDKIRKGGETMLVMSKAADWQVIQGPTYAQFSGEFRRSVDRMVKMAKKKQLDSAALGYMHVTMTCINCHKYVKNAKVAQGRPLSPGLKFALRQDKRTSR